MTSSSQPIENMPEDVFYHHSSWPERWSHPSFQKKQEWVNHLWYRESGRYASSFLHRNISEDFPWGFIIYRTIYTPESDELWPAVLSKFTRYIHYEIDCQCDVVDDRMPEQLVHESHQDVIISDKKWDGASVDQIRENFLSYLVTTPRGLEFTNPRFKGCLVIDAPALESLLHAPEPENWQFGMQRPFVGMVDAQYVEGQRWMPTGYWGYIRVELGHLWFLYLQLTWDDLHELVLPAGEFIPVYNEDLGSAQDEEGNPQSVLRNRGGRRT
ncbi:hypothetical protein FE257_008183 [Aspergillus nanangensis]|uniref:Uncharacterized protein n=1 Tax=Aspergillus nanangensis TaxID=2582783 RepID=A0AAD4CLN7_ASPNN|nr:hypothetical protein FE257_008183 [Aspergillus nanangensis]